MKFYLVILFVFVNLGFSMTNTSEVELEKKTFTPSVNSTFFTNRYKSSSVNSNIFLFSSASLAHQITDKIKLNYKLTHNKSLENFREGDLNDFRISTQLFSKKINDNFNISMGADIRLAISDYRKDVLYEDGSGMISAKMKVKLKEESKVSLDFSTQFRKYSHEFKQSFVGESNQNYSLLLSSAINIALSKKLYFYSFYSLLKPYTYNQKEKSSLASFGVDLGYSISKNFSVNIGMASDNTLLDDVGQLKDLNKYFLTNRSLLYSGLTLSL